MYVGFCQTLSETLKTCILMKRLMFDIVVSLCFLSVFFVFIVSLVFAEMAREADYFPRPWMLFLSWSYGFNVISGFFSAFGGICLFIKAMILKDKLFEAPNKKLEKELQGGTSQSGSASVITGPSIGGASAGTGSKVGESFV